MIGGWNSWESGVGHDGNGASRGRENTPFWFVSRVTHVNTVGQSGQ
jgi:hypothetical protein